LIINRQVVHELNQELEMLVGDLILDEEFEVAVPFDCDMDIHSGRYRTPLVNKNQETVEGWVVFLLRDNNNMLSISPYMEAVFLDRHFCNYEMDRVCEGKLISAMMIEEFEL